MDNVQKILFRPNTCGSSTQSRTSNFRFERGYSAISIGYIERGIIMAAAVYDPFRDQLFTAQKGMGSYLNAKKFTTSTQDEIGKATIATDNSYDPAGTRHNLELMLKSITNSLVHDARKRSTLYVRCCCWQSRHVYFHTSLKPWDNAAAFLIAEEASAIVVGIDGTSINFMSDHVVIGHQNLVNQFLDSMK